MTSRFARRFLVAGSMLALVVTLGLVQGASASGTTSGRAARARVVETASSGMTSTASRPSPAVNGASLAAIGSNSSRGSSSGSHT